ncbi:MAG: fuconate dehydratase [Rhodobacterales bacterium]|nr:fuconate dehydratase [Rhodobacterales bacterium]
MIKITGIKTFDLRFPTSDYLDGSDAMNPDPDYSAAYIILVTDAGLEGHGLTFTIGRGNELCISAFKALEPLILGLDLSWITHDMGRFWRHLTGDSQLRWVGPDKGILHLATGAVVNAVWDLWGKYEKKPVWQLVYDMSPKEIVRLIDFRYLTDALKPEEALEILENSSADKKNRLSILMDEGYPCYNTSAGWLGYSDEKLYELCVKAKKSGFSHLKFKVGKDLNDDIRRLKIARKALGTDVRIMIDANQVWEVDEAIEWIKELEFADPFFIEEPTSPDDIAGHKKIKDAIQPIKVATGEMCQNRIIFKQFIQDNALDIVQIDSCRIGGLNEILSVLLLAHKYDKPVWPHAGGVGLCEYVQHIAMIDYLLISCEKNSKRIEYVDHLHEHFEDPVVIKNGNYMPPQKPGYSITMKPESISAHLFPNGSVWKALRKS